MESTDMIAGERLEQLARPRTFRTRREAVEAVEALGWVDTGFRSRGAIIAEPPEADYPHLVLRNAANREWPAMADISTSVWESARVGADGQSDGEGESGRHIHEIDCGVEITVNVNRYGLPTLEQAEALLAEVGHHVRRLAGDWQERPAK